MSFSDLNYLELGDFANFDTFLKENIFFQMAIYFESSYFVLLCFEFYYKLQVFLKFFSLSIQGLLSLFMAPFLNKIFGH